MLRKTPRRIRTNRIFHLVRIDNCTTLIWTYLLKQKHKMFNRNVQKRWSKQQAQLVPGVVMKDKELAVASRISVSQLNGNNLHTRNWDDNKWWPRTLISWERSQKNALLLTRNSKTLSVIRSKLKKRKKKQRQQNYPEVYRKVAKSRVNLKHQKRIMRSHKRGGWILHKKWICLGEVKQTTSSRWASKCLSHLKLFQKRVIFYSKEILRVGDLHRKNQFSTQHLA